jgi:hypothetical protein
VASPLENLSGPGKPLRQEPPDEREYSGLKRSALAVRNLREYEGDLNIDERLVADLITACRSVARKLDSLAPIAPAKRP